MTQQIDVDDFLEHFGKKGMKWGQRNDDSGGGSGGGAGDIKSQKKAARMEVRREFKAVRKDAMKVDRADGSRTTSKGKLIGGAMIDANTLGMYAGARVARSAGASKGKAAAISIISGPPGAILYKELKVRQRVNSDFN